MKIKKEIAILFFIIAVLVFYIYSEKGDKTHYELPEIGTVRNDDITRITIRKGDREIQLVREADEWLVGDKKYPADGAVVETILKGISGLTLTALASESKNYALYELEENKRIDVKAYKGDTLLRRVSIGKAASSYQHTFVMIDDDYRVYHAGGNIKNDFDKNISDMRDKEVMAITDDIAEIVLKREKRELKIVRATAPVSVDVTGEENAGGDQKTKEAGPKWVTAEGRAVQEPEIDGMMNTLSSFKCDEFIEEKSKDDFQSPIFTAVLKGVKTYSISLFEKEGNQYPAVSSGSDYPFLISEWKANKIMKDFESLLKKGK